MAGQISKHCLKFKPLFSLSLDLRHVTSISTGHSGNISISPLWLSFLSSLVPSPPRLPLDPPRFGSRKGRKAISGRGLTSLTTLRPGLSALRAGFRSHTL